jgi:hypothetical protein
VTLPPGLSKLATRPSLTGSLPVWKTIAIVEVAALAVYSDTLHDAKREFAPAARVRASFIGRIAVTEVICVTSFRPRSTTNAQVRTIKL